MDRSHADAASGLTAGLGIVGSTSQPISVDNKGRSQIWPQLVHLVSHIPSLDDCIAEMCQTGFLLKLGKSTNKARGVVKALQSHGKKCFEMVKSCHVPNDKR